MGGYEDYDIVDDDWVSSRFRSVQNTRPVVLNIERVIQESKKAWHIEFPMDDNLDNVTCWLPKSQCALRAEKKKIQVPEWLVIENELEDYKEENDEN